MAEINILTEADLRAAVPLDLDAIDCVEQGFAALAGGEVVMPPILSLEESFSDPHMQARENYVTVAGHPQAAPAPRFSKAQPGTPTPPEPPAGPEALAGWISDADLPRYLAAVK